jgi:hypothetical protein
VNNRVRPGISWSQIRLMSLLGLALLPATVLSQSSSEYDQWKQAYLNEFENYKDEIDREFAQFLKQKWKKFDTEAGVERDPVPKPDAIPQEVPKTAKAPKPVSTPAKPIVEPVDNDSAKQAQLPAAVIDDGEKISLVFLGHDVSLFIKFDRDFALDNTITQKSLQTGFDYLAQSDYENLVVDLAGIRESLRLNDWAYMQLVEQFSRAVVPDSTNSARLLSWFLLLKSGLKSRIAFADNEIYLLASTQQPLYDTTFFKFNNERFYVISRHVKISKKLASYNGNYPQELPLSDFAGINEIIPGMARDYRNITFSYGGTAYDIRIPFNRHVIEFFSSYPQMDIEHYFNVAISQETQDSLLQQLQPLVDQLSQEEAVNFLLRLVQTGFDYKTDNMQFGMENYLFLEETIYYPSSDCEDRSVIFAWLVENLLGLQVVGLGFPGHVATAVELDSPRGESIEHEGRIFSIADPTFIYAGVGQKMPKFKNVSPKVITYH